MFVLFALGGIKMELRDKIRVIEGFPKEGISFKTKGDNNTGADTELVKPEDVKGIITYTVPKIGWPTLQDAMDEIKERLIPENTLLVAVENGSVIGWGGILAPTYNGNVFELHPLAVQSNKRNQGIGRAIVTALEDEARKQGSLTIHLGADDEIGDGETSFANVDLFDDLIKVQQPQVKELLFASIQKVHSDLLSHSLETNDAVAKQMYNNNANKVNSANSVSIWCMGSTKNLLIQRLGFFNSL